MARYRSPAMKAYTRRLLVLMSFYLVTLWGSITLVKSGAAGGIWHVPLAILPALPIIGVFWAVMRLLVEEPDEYWRMLLVRQCLIATGFCLTVMTIWEFLQNFDVVAPGQHGFGAAMWWFIGLGIGALYNRLTLGRDGGGCA